MRASNVSVILMSSQVSDGYVLSSYCYAFSRLKYFIIKGLNKQEKNPSEKWHMGPESLYTGSKKRKSFGAREPSQRDRPSGEVLDSSRMLGCSTPQP